MYEGFEIVRKRQFSIARALAAAEVKYALSGSNASFLWIESVDDSAVRLYRNVEFIIRRDDEHRAANVLTELGLEPESNSSGLLIRNQVIRRDRNSDRAWFANENLPNSGCHVPNIEPVKIIKDIRILPLLVLVDFQLSRWTLDDKVDLRDMIDVGLVDKSWVAKFQPELAARLQHLLDTPEG